MEESLDDNPNTKDSLINQSNICDSGIYSGNDQSTCDNSNDASSPERKYFCPICNKMLTSQHNFTLHIRSHNNETEDQITEKGFACRICQKVLSSSSSLDRHVLVHSGERPFQCKYCGDTFTTNGNMHRHMRTHSKGENYESDGSTESSTSTKSIEYNNNNNKVCNKRKHEDLEELKDCKKIALEGRESFKCPVCDRSDFNTVEILHCHLEDNHPEYPAKCNLCNQVFLNNKLLTTHKEEFHSNPKQSVNGFEDLTFMEFSSKKFPYIARHECERSLHKPTGGDLKFQCQKCTKAFPCSNSLNIHEKSCLVDLPLPMYKSNGISEDEIRRAEFFSRLDLQDNSPEKKVPIIAPFRDFSTKLLQEQLAKVDTKDLADIQSILRNIHHQFPTKPNQDLRMPPAAKPLLELNNDSTKNDNNEEESQDSFAIEFRKMKLRGEFPCRLCTAVFPNLRALKGHNRAHLSGNTNGTYYCNMCPHSSIDKAALIRHMRTHNGDRPYECSLCNYAFTTKANCERHLRNRHSKTTREDVKKSIIYHPSEDPTNDELNKLTIRDDSKKHSFSDSRDLSPEKLHCSTPKVTTPKLKTTEVTFSTPTLIPQKLFNNIPLLHNDSLVAEPRYNTFIPQPFNLTSVKIPQQPNIPSKIHVKPFEALKENSFTQSDDDEYYEDEEDEPPMDVALDLSKKKLDEDQKRLQEEEPQDLSKKSCSASPTEPNVNELFAQQLLKTPAKFDPATVMYATQLAHFYRNFSSWPGFPVNPLLFQAIPTLQQPQDIKERLQRMCGGSMINDNFSPTPLNQPQLDSPPLYKVHNELSQNGFNRPRAKSMDELEDTKPLSVNVDFNNHHQSKPPSPINHQMQSPNSVKMVIKNGVLMPKQKQRRYRTERPFTCEHCSAKFTLRSNMERHIKQQHPQYWSQRQRSNVGQPGRKPQGHLLKPTGYCEGYDLSRFSNQHESADERVTEKLRIALLSQLRPNHFNQQDIKKEDDDDCALVIDENDIKNDECVDVDDTQQEKGMKNEDDLVPVSRLLVNASQPFKEYFKREGEEQEVGIASEEDEEGLVASGSTSEGNVSGTDENR